MRTCGLHAMNNMVGLAKWDFDKMDQLAAVTASELQERKSRHVSRAGDFSSETLAAALLDSTPYRLEGQRATWPVQWTPDLRGLLVHKGSRLCGHWMTVRRSEDGRVWLLDSLAPAPQLLTQCRLRSLVSRQTDGGGAYAVRVAPVDGDAA